VGVHSAGDQDASYEILSPRSIADKESSRAHKGEFRWLA
jgi:hypothetical protein